MIRPARLLLLVVPLALGLASLHEPGGAQTAPPAAEGRFAFSDTTLLRDTLNLKFTRLFPLADSLGIPPDSLRALSIRYRLSLERLMTLSDSLQAPIDSVGAIMRREQFNPLSQRVQRLNALRYTSSYNLAQTSSTWSNGADWNFVQGAAFVRNNTNINLDRNNVGSVVNLRQTRAALTEAGWKFSPSLSIGARTNLERFDTHNPGSSLSDEAEDKKEFQLSTRSKQQPSRNLQSDFNLFTGLLDLSNSSQVKRGISGDLSGHARYQRGSFLSHDVTARSSGNLSRTRLPTETRSVGTRDLSNNVDGTLAMFQSSLTRINLNYSLRRVRVETPRDSGRIQQIRTDTDGLTSAVKMQLSSDRYLGVSERIGRATNANASNLSSLNTRSDQEFKVEAHYDYFAWHLDTNFDNTFSSTRFPQRAATGGYVDKTSARWVQATLKHTFLGKFAFMADGRVSLTVSRYGTIGSYPNPPVDRDQYRQSFRLDGQYNRSQEFSTGVGLEVIRQQFVNIPSASTGANNEVRTYRADWRWTFQLWPGFTANQRNELSADYTFFNFLPANNRVSLIYKSLTTLNGTFTPRTTFEITHDAQFLPSGNYTRQYDGLETFSESDEGKNYTLRARVTFSPSTLLSLDVQSEYLSSLRSTVTSGGSFPQRDSRTLNFSGGANLNLPLGPQGRLTGDVRRTYRDDRAIAFDSGVARPTPRSEFDYWFGRLELEWNL